MTDELTAVAYVAGGIWVARCPRPWCVNTEWFGPGPVSGRLGGLSRDRFQCTRAECGLACRADWPRNPEAIWRVLQQRPFRETRNWEPWERVEDLIRENVEHGLIEAERLDGLIVHNWELAGPAHDLIPAVGAGSTVAAIGGR